MVFKSFRLAAVSRVILLLISILTFTWLVLVSDLHFTAAIIGVLIIVQAYSLIRFVETSNRDLARFLESIEFADFSQTFSEGRGGKTFEQLRAAFADVSGRFREIRMEREESLHYLQAVVKHVGVGIIAFTEDGTIELFNNTARRLLDQPPVRNIESLKQVSPDLVERLQAGRLGQRELVTITGSHEQMQLAIRIVRLRMRHRRITLATFQNITTELNQKEMDAWQNLIRVLTHEIKNSLTPIASLAATVEEHVAADPVDQESGRSGNSEDSRQALKTIQRRSQSLLEFVDAYRDLTHIPKPEFKVLSASELIERVLNLIFPPGSEVGIVVTSSVEPTSLTLTADPHLMEQVLINLLLNAQAALKDRTGGRIRIVAQKNVAGRVILEVNDNGPGIVEDALDKIFIPFFTTRKGGSGIGLSLSRQIMRLHGGDLTVRSEPDKATVFTMRF